MKITDYMLVKTEHLQDLVDQVNEHIAKDWQPFGSMTFVPTYADNSGKQYVQLLVKYKDEQ